MISAHSGAHSFDAAKMNMTHHVGLFSFGNKQSWRSMKDANRLLPELDSDIDHLTGEFFISEHENITVCLDSCPSVILSLLSCSDTQQLIVSMFLTCLAFFRSFLSLTTVLRMCCLDLNLDWDSA